MHELVDNPSPGMESLSFREQAAYAFLGDMDDTLDFTVGGCPKYYSGCLCMLCLDRVELAQKKLSEGDEILGHLFREYGEGLVEASSLESIEHDWE